MAASTEKDAETMPTQKTFKHRVRTRMTKTGESYAAARHQLLRKAPEPEPPPAAPRTMVSTDAIVRATGRTHDEWFAILDAWGATSHQHTAIATHVRDDLGVPGWWAQNITVDYERARGMRAPHQMASGFSVSANRTLGASAQRALAAFTDPSVRERWLPTPMQPRPTRAKLTGRFDWPDPPSRVVVVVAEKGADKSTVSLAHEQLPDAESAARLKTAWREWLGALKALVEGD